MFIWCVGVVLLHFAWGLQAPHRMLLQKTSRSFNYSLEHRLSDPNGESLDNFGRSVSLNGNILAVGAPEDNENYIATDTGRVFIFVRSKHDIRQWMEIREIYDGEAGEYFGWSVSVADDKTLLVGAPRSNMYGGFSGTVFYGEIEDNMYRAQPDLVRLVQSERHAGAFFGYCIATQTNSDGVIRAAIGAYGHKGTGAVFMYTKKSDGSFGNEEIIYASDRTSGYRFGWSVSMHLDQLVVGSPMADGYGAAYVYLRSGYQWNFNTKLQQYWDSADDDQNPFAGDFFGLSVAAGDGVVFVGSPHNDVKKEDAGAVLVYADKVYVPDRRRLQGDNDTRRLALPEYEFSQTLFAPTTTAYQRFGWCLDYDPIYGRLAVGSDYTKVSSYAGAAYIYSLGNDGFFALEFMEKADSDEDTEANFGESISIQGDVVAIGASKGHGMSYKSGDVYVFTARTKSEYYDYISTSKNSSKESGGISAFSVSVIIALLVFLVIIGILWRKYKRSGEKLGFCTFIADQVTDLTDYFTNSRAERGIPVPLQDDSLHSTHAMMSSSTSKFDTRPSKFDSTPSVELAKPSERIQAAKKPIRAGGGRTSQLKSSLGASRAGGYAGVQQSSDV